MGAQNSNLRRTIEDEFAAKVQDSGRDWLRLDELLALQLPQSSWSLPLCHLGVLYVLDREQCGRFIVAEVRETLLLRRARCRLCFQSDNFHRELDGRFSMEDVSEMLALGRARCRMYQPHEFADQLAGYCTLQLWKAMYANGGRAAFVDWLCRLMTENMETERFSRDPGHVFLNRDCIRTLHQVLDIKENQGLDLQAFFDLLQRIAEARGLMDPADEALDDWLPVEALRECSGAIADGIMRTMSSICPGDAAALEF